MLVLVKVCEAKRMPSTSYTMNVEEGRKRERRRIGVIHVCDLPKRENIVVHYIRYGYFVHLRRRFRRLLMVSDTNPLCKIYLKSSVAIRMEQTKHLHENYYMIHPFSNFQRFFELFMLIILTLLFIIIPVDNCFHDKYLTFFKLILDLCTIFSIIITFWTGFKHSLRHNIIMNKKSIARRYLLGYFIVDFVTSITIFIVIIQQTFEPDLLSLRTVLYIKMINYLKIFRFITWMRYWECFRQWMQLNIYLFKIKKLFLYYIFTIWWSACILYVVQFFPNSESSLYDRNINLDYETLMNCFYHAIYMIFLIGSGEQPTDKIYLLMIQIVVLLIGNFLYIYTIAQVMHIVQKYNSSKTKYAEIQQQLQDFLKQKEVPEYTRRRVMLYFNFRYQTHFYRETEVLNTLSKNLRQEIFLYLCKDLVMNAKMFKVIPTPLVNRIVSIMRTKIYLCNDLIVKAGTDGSEMFFLHSGTVAVYTPNGREVCHLAEGSNFGEVSLIFEYITRAASVIAIDTVEIYTLSRQDFIKAIEPFPDVYHSIRATAELHMNNVFLDSDISMLGSGTTLSLNKRSDSEDSSKTKSDSLDDTKKSLNIVISRSHYYV